jgi:hypothetical protein
MAKKKIRKDRPNTLADIGFISPGTPLSREDAERLWGWRRKLRDEEQRPKPRK